MKKNIIIFTCFIAYINILNGQSPKKYYYVKCFPFRTSTYVPVLERNIEKMPINSHFRVYENRIEKKKDVKKISKIFSNLDKSENSVEDYSLRAFFREYSQNGIEKTYYLNWDKKYIIYEKEFYVIDSIKYLKLINYLDCKCR